jgi:hypothetical protein
MFIIYPWRLDQLAARFVAVHGRWGARGLHWSIYQWTTGTFVQNVHNLDPGMDFLFF